MTTMTTKLKEIVQKVEKQFPGAWKKAAQARNERGKSLLGWPNWCYLPMDVWVNVARDTHAANVVQELHPSSLIESLAAVGAWRITKSVYRFDPDIFREIVDTPVDGNLPCEIVRRLPEWCLFIETPGFEWGGASIDGFFAHLHKCRCCGEEALQLLIVAGDTLVSQSVSLGGWTLLEGIERSFLKDPHYIFGLMPEEEKLRRTNASSLLVAPLLSLLSISARPTPKSGTVRRGPVIPRPSKSAEEERRFSRLKLPGYGTSENGQEMRYGGVDSNPPSQGDIILPERVPRNAPTSGGRTGTDTGPGRARGTRNTKSSGFLRRRLKLTTSKIFPSSTARSRRGGVPHNAGTAFEGRSGREREEKRNSCSRVEAGCIRTGNNMSRKSFGA